MKWIDTGDLNNWANGKQRHCAQTLPELIRRLILATGNVPPEEIDFPSGDSIATGGWDGRLKTTAASPFFPSGASGWEIGVEKSPGKKAEKDILKRVADPLGLTAKETTFVFVTPRRWPGRGKWQAGKKLTQQWKDVRVIGADGLEQWLDAAPTVALWLARQIGKGLPAGIRDLENVWDEWSLATNPGMTAEVVTGGRTKEKERIQQWIAHAPASLEMKGDSPDEAVAFLYAAISGLPETERVRALSRCIVAENIEDMRHVIQAFEQPLIIVAPGECVEAAGTAIEKGHHVFLSVDAKVIDIGNGGLRLSRPHRSVVETNLEQNGFSKTEAQSLARDFGRSIPVLRRHLSRTSTVSAPKWANADSARLLIPALFAGSWAEQKEGDRKVIEELSGMTYDEFTGQLEQFLTIDDSPVRKIGGVWMLKSPLDAWVLLARHLNPNFLRVFRQSILAVLTQTDPKYDLPVENRWAAVIYGKSSQYSGYIRTGLVESLVLLAVFGDRSPHIASTQAFASAVVKEIFGAADKWDAWASLKDVTPLLGEAAPDTFMEAVEEGIARNPKIFEELMRDDAGIFGECRHSGLLWALESLAWSSSYFSRVVDILRTLAKIDPGGQWNNRAKNSLRDIFLPGLPQTYAKPAERLAALDVLTRSDPRMVWTFAKKYYSEGGISESYRFRWRDAGGERPGLVSENQEDQQEYLKGLLPRLSDLACAREDLVSTADAFVRLPAEIRGRFITTLETVDPATLSKEERTELLRHIRLTLNWINSYGDQDRRAHVPGLNGILERFKPEDVLERVDWLLNNPWPRLPQGESEDYQATDEAVKTAREQAAREVLDTVPVEQIVQYAGTIQYVRLLGHALGKVIHDEKEDAAILDALIGQTTNNPDVIIGYALGRVEIVGPDWVEKQVERMKAQGNYSPKGCALLHLGLEEGEATWSQVRAHGEDVDHAYWKFATGRSRTDKASDTPTAIERLLDAHRPDTALEIAGDPQLSLPSALLQRLIQDLLAFEPKDKFRLGTMEEFHLGHVFRQLYERNELAIEEIAKLEWPFAARFDEVRRYTSVPLAIHRVLQRDPSGFAQLVSFTYKRDDHATDSAHDRMDQEGIQHIARNAREVLNSWHLIPGLQKDGSLDEKTLTEWVESARQQCAAANRVIGGDLQIAEMLSRAPSDGDGAWPHIAVRNLIERLKSKVIDEHIQMGVYNSRGVVARGITDGGNQERTLSERYKAMSDTVRAKWPRTAAILRSLADSYEQYAKHEDISSDLMDLRLG